MVAQTEKALQTIMGIQTIKRVYEFYEANRDYGKKYRISNMLLLKMMLMRYLIKVIVSRDQHILSLYLKTYDSFLVQIKTIQ